MTDADIDYSDIPPLDDKFFEKLIVPWPPSKKQLTIRLDEDVLEWIKAQGKGYQNRINYILRAAMDSQQRHNQSPLLWVSLRALQVAVLYTSPLF